MVLPEYMSRLDSPQPASALGCQEPDLRFLLALPAGHVSGTSREDFAAYIAGRNPVDREHVVMARSTAGEIEFAYGYVTEAGRTIGHFLSAVAVSGEGRMSRYLSFFDPEFTLLPGLAPQATGRGDDGGEPG